MSESTRKDRKPRKQASAGKRAKVPQAQAIVPAAASARLAPTGRTEEEWREWTDSLVDRMNLSVRKAGLEKEEAADALFRETFGQDWLRALDPAGDPTEEYERIRAREGRTLRLDTHEHLQDYVRIGALNQHRRDSAWRGLDWSFKVELLPLLGPRVEFVEGREVRVIDRDRFNEGLKFANKPNVGAIHIRKYVQDEVPASALGRPRGESVTLPRAGRFTATGVMLGDEAQRAKFVDRVQALPAKARRALIKDLRETQENLEKLLAEFDDE